jgi:hypothetical protein
MDIAIAPSVQGPLAHLGGTSEGRMGAEKRPNVE